MGRELDGQPGFESILVIFAGTVEVGITAKLGLDVLFGR